jgi:transcriptional regulator with XRE-family HTH domain
MALQDLKNKLGLDDDFDRRVEAEYPFAAVAEAVLNLRVRHLLSQAVLARRIGSTQSVIARLESGRHPAEMSLLNRIADAVGERWRPSFLADPSATTKGDIIEPEDDELLQAFNSANTTEDFAEAHRVAGLLADGPSSGRRCLAIALDAYNRHAYKEAVEWAARALGMDLPEISRKTADLVHARGLLALDRPREAIAELRPYETSQDLGGMLAVAFVQALLESGRPARADVAAKRAVATGIHSPELSLIWARVALSRDFPWEALAHVLRFRAYDDADLDGVLLHATVLGYLGDVGGASGAHAESYRVLKSVVPRGGCAAWRLYGVSAARTGRWRETIKAARRLRHAHQDLDRHTTDIRTLLEQALEAASQVSPDEVLAAASAAETIISDRPRWLARARARAIASKGDVDAVRFELGLRSPVVTTAIAADRVLLARALAVAGRCDEALTLLRPSMAALHAPADLFFAAETAVEAGDLGLAKDAMGRLADGKGPAAKAAAIAMHVLTSAEATEPAEALRAAVGALGAQGNGARAGLWVAWSPSEPRSLARVNANGAALGELVTVAGGAGVPEPKSL